MVVWVGGRERYSTHYSLLVPLHSADAGKPASYMGR
jgi:hypothetical protein